MMASHFFSRVRYLHSLRSALLRSHPSPLRTLPIPSPLPFSSRLPRQEPAFPNPRFFSCSSSGSVANDEAVHSEAEDRKVENGDGASSANAANDEAVHSEAEDRKVENGDGASSASVANEEAVYSEAEDRKVENGDGAPDGDKKGSSELFKRLTAGTDPENGKLRQSGSGPRGKRRRTISKRKRLSRKSGASKESKVVVEEELMKGIDELKKNLRALEETLKNSKEKPVGKPNNLSSLFAASDRKARRRSSNPVEKDLFSFEDVSANDFSPELISFVERLIEEGHMQKANFLNDGKLEVNSLCSSYARNFVRSAAEQFAREHQEIAKWLSGSELKKVALVGCPQIDRKTTFSAKKLRSFFEIQENNVCEACQLKELCSFKNKGVQTEENLNLVNVLRVLTIYALNSAHLQLVVSQETKESVSKILKEVIDLSK